MLVRRGAPPLDPPLVMVWIKTFTSRFQEYEEPDVTMTTLKFASGALVVIELHYVSSVKFDMRLEVTLKHYIHIKRSGENLLVAHG